MRNMFLGVVALAALAVSGVANAQNGHFITSGKNAPSCEPSGTQFICSGKVAGLGGETFEIVVEVTGFVTGDCINPSGNPAGSTPGQAGYEFTAEATTGPRETPRNGQYTFNLLTGEPGDVNPCPNPNKWEFEPTSVTFTSAHFSLYEDGFLVDEFP